MASSEIIDRIRDASDIVSVVEEYFPLKRAGSNYKACCPFHNEKTPSFVVSPAKQIFHCFGCGESGNVFNFVMKMEGLPFPDVLQRFSDRTGIELDKNFAQKGYKKNNAIKDLLYKVNSEAAKIYQDELINNKAGSAYKYMEGRGLDENSLKKFQIGYAPNTNPITRRLNTTPEIEKILIKAGLVFRNRRGGISDMFRERVMFPIQDDMGKICGFGGRAMDDGIKPKYLNTPQTLIFEKKKILYGFSNAKDSIKNENRALILEGYMDVIAAHQFGINTAVATLGTALSEDHIRKLKFWSDELYFIFDADEAGRKAAERGFELLIDKDMSAKVIELPAGNDPEDIIRGDVSKFIDYVEGSISIYEWMIKRSVSKYSDISDRSVRATRIIKDLGSFIRSLSDNPIARHEFVGKLMGELHIPALAKERFEKKIYKELRNKEVRSAGSAAMEKVNKKTLIDDNKLDRQDRLIKQIFHVIIKYPKLSVLLEGIDDLDHGAGIYSGLLRDFIRKYNSDIHSMLNDSDTAVRKMITESAIIEPKEGQMHPKDFLMKLIEEYKMCSLQKRFELISDEIRRLIDDGVPVSKEKKEEYNKLAKVLKAI